MSSQTLTMSACVLREPGRPPATETVTLDPPGPGEVRVRVAAAGVCHSDVHLADGSLGRGRWPMVLGHEGAGVVEAVGAGVNVPAVGDRVVFSMVPSCGTCEQCAAGRPTLCIPAGNASIAGELPGGGSRLRDADGAVLQHALTVACFAQYAVVAAAGAIPIGDSIPLWQAALLGCGVVTGFGAVANAARVRAGERVAVIGCGGVGLQVIAALKLAGAATIVAVDRRPEKLEHALRRGATHAVDAGSDEPAPAAAIRELTGGGVEHAFE
ncbi:MAG: alcohol dehydrogenase catalytic domain-containing protein, partial [Solirubrobacteraceae bacterium]